MVVFTEIVRRTSKLDSLSSIYIRIIMNTISE